MKIFHLDGNTAHFRTDYLRSFIERLRHAGYDTLLWETEAYVRWDSCPECAAPDALSKIEFKRELLDFAEASGFVNIPLLQTLGHCEYVLDLPRYQNLRENPGYNAPYCPEAPGFAEFIARWIGEYCDVFDRAPFFHLGCDETWRLGQSCPRCPSRSIPELIAAHVRRCAEVLRRRNKRPALWADMALIHPDMAELLPADALLFDWRYEIYPGCGGVWCWDERGGALTTPEKIPEPVRKNFAPQLYPAGRGNAPELFYTSRFLKCILSNHFRNGTVRPRGQPILHPKKLK